MKSKLLSDQLPSTNKTQFDDVEILEIKKELQLHLASIIAECYNVEDNFKKDLTIKGVRFKLFLNDSVDEILKLQQKLNKII
jgi:hypothetical protein